MGATFFALWMIGFLFCGLFSLAVGLLALFSRRRRKAQGRSYTLSTVLAVVYLALALLLLLPSVGFFGFIRITNMAHNATDGFVDTGVYVEGGFQDTEFTVEGTTYRRLEDLSFHRTEGTEYPAVFSWDNVGDEWNPLFLLFGTYHDRGNYCSVPNEPGFDLICGGWRLFCPTDQTEAVTAWYSDLTHFTWQSYVSLEDPYAPMDPQPTPEAMAALVTLYEQAKEEGHTLWTSADPKALPAGPVEDSPLGAVVAILPKGEGPVPALTLLPVSWDGAVQGESMTLYRYENRLWFSPNSAYWEDTSAHYLAPLPAWLEETLTQ